MSSLRFRFRSKSAKHREEAAKLAASVLNGVSIACLIGATFGPWLNPALDWGWTSLALLAGVAIFHGVAQAILRAGFEEANE
ncbi:MAG: hypothetical protein A4S17_12735 [Proteobacteria bacterium HN_bin10]|nr:MAG: hypothetical protein A4S17_12735 [Proteobacteria bacterium HN_bin10]